MIIFKKLRWKNLLSTGNVFTEIDLTAKNTTLIIGENGAGKSTILMLFHLDCLVSRSARLTRDS